jgi:hypothetical protein
MITLADRSVFSQRIGRGLGYQPDDGHIHRSQVGNPLVNLTVHIDSLDREASLTARQLSVIVTGWMTICFSGGTRSSLVRVPGGIECQWPPETAHWRPTYPSPQ